MATGSAPRLRDLLLQPLVSSGPGRHRPAPHRPRRGPRARRSPRGLGGGRSPLLRSAPLGRRAGSAAARARRALPVRARGTKRRADPARVGHRAAGRALCRARGELPELLRLVLSGRARGAAARRGRRADGSADHRPGRLACARRTGARFVYLCQDVFPEVARLLGDFRSERVDRLLERVTRLLIARADRVVAVGETMRSGSWPARMLIPAASRSSTTGRIARPSSPDRSAIRGRSPTAWPSRSSSCTPAISASPRISTSSSMPPRGSPHIPTSSSPSSATA